MTVNALHPGVVMSDFVKSFSPLLDMLFKFFGRLFFKVSDLFVTNRAIPFFLVIFWVFFN